MQLKESGDWLMSNASIKNKRIPNAPKPTKPLSSLDPREKERIQRIKESSKDLIRGFKNTKSVARAGGSDALKWTDEKIEKLSRIWKEGYSIEICAREISMPKEQTIFKINQLIDEGMLFQRKEELNNEEIKRARAQLEYGIDPHVIAEEMRVDIRMINHLCRKEKQ